MQKINDEKIEVSAKVLGALLKSHLRLEKLVAELLELPEYNKDWLTPKDLEEEFKIGEKQLRKFRGMGLPVVQKGVNCARRIKRSEIEKFLMKK
ncbi:hypothetical protein ABS768_06300 [Flavobacterium sp. ST-75]|uniref:Helix-turn-helix domain-containing protein n=1 Tax=Flavobacterium rhizophilum TaxID=3163296 RepID=A0ABW8YA59_9FLAO